MKLQSFRAIALVLLGAAPLAACSSFKPPEIDYDDLLLPAALQSDPRNLPAARFLAGNLLSATGDQAGAADAYLDSARMMTADFVQIGPDGQRSEGQLYVDRPGRMLFHYDAPARLEIVADGRSVAVRDQKLDTQDLYFIAQTPLKFLLKDHVDLAKDTTVRRVTIDGNAATIEIEDKATFGGSAEIALVFDPDSFALKQWTVIDAQGFQTVVSLFNVDLTSKPDPDIFRIQEAIPGEQTSRH